MSIAALGLVLIAALLHACWNVVAKKTGGDARFALLRQRSGFGEVWRAQWRSALVVAVLGPLGYVLVLYAMRLAPVSHVAPAREVSMLFAALIGGRLLGEGDRALRFVGAACIGCGVAGLALG